MRYVGFASGLFGASLEFLIKIEVANSESKTPIPKYMSIVLKLNFSVSRPDGQFPWPLASGIDLVPGSPVRNVPRVGCQNQPLEIRDVYAHSWPVCHDPLKKFPTGNFYAPPASHG